MLPFWQRIPKNAQGRAGGGGSQWAFQYHRPSVVRALVPTVRAGAAVLWDGKGR